MDRAARIAVAKQLIEWVERNDTQYADEPAWETDIGRFVDPERFAREKAAFFENHAQIIAYSADLPNPGDYYATEIAGKPILLTRDKAGKAHAFLNACRHRGVKLAESCGHANKFTCPYHAWTFANDGALIGVPSRDAFDGLLEDRGLIALPIAEQIGLILVHPQPDGEVDFDGFMGPLKDLLAGYGLEQLRLVHEFRTTARINWKHAVDGGVEGYHVPFLHPTTVGPATAPQFLHIDSGLHQTLVTADPDIGALRDLPEEEWPEYCRFALSNAIFPNTVIGFGRTIAFLQRSDPGEHVGTCDYVFRVYGWGREPTPEQEQIDRFVADMLVKVAMDEDMKVQSSAQVAMEKGASPTIVFGRREQNIMRMHKTYDRMIGHDAEAAVAAAKMKLAAE